MIKTDYIYNAKITNVVDGDTVDMTVGLGFNTYINERFRLAHIDTAELNSSDPELRKLATDAKLFMIAYMNLDVTIKSYKKDKYGRFLAEIYLPGDTESLNTKLLNAGLAKPYL